MRIGIVYIIVLLVLASIFTIGSRTLLAFATQHRLDYRHLLAHPFDAVHRLGSLADVVPDSYLHPKGGFQFRVACGVLGVLHDGEGLRVGLAVDC